MDRLSAVVASVAFLARDLVAVANGHELKVYGHDLWWVPVTLGEPDALERLPIADD